MEILLINTGGTFNKRYNPIKGELEVPSDNIALDDIIESCHNIDFEIRNIISKDSLDIDNDDRKLIVDTIKKSDAKKVIIVHGTDTMDLTASYLKEFIDDKVVVLTGAMVPMSIKKVEATMNFSIALGFLNAENKNDIYIAMHGLAVKSDRLYKNRKEGKFLLKD